MNRSRTVRIAGSAGALFLALGVVSATPAFAGDDEVIRNGNCSGSADWKLKTKTDDGGLEVEGEVDSNTSGQQWTWRIMHNGNTAARGTATTRGRSGSFSVERRIANSPGTDSIGFRAHNAGSGQTCRGHLNF